MFRFELVQYLIVLIMKEFIHFFVLSCNQATLLIEKKMHARLTYVEHFQLKLHLHICMYCRFYEKEAMFIDKAIHKLKDQISVDDISGFSEEEMLQAKNKLRKLVRENKSGMD